MYDLFHFSNMISSQHLSQPLKEITEYNVRNPSNIPSKSEEILRRELNQLENSIRDVMELIYSMQHKVLKQQNALLLKLEVWISFFSKVK